MGCRLTAGRRALTAVVVVRIHASQLSLLGDNGSTPPW